MTKSVAVIPDGDKFNIEITGNKSTWFKSITLEQAEMLLIELLPLVLSAKEESNEQTN